jgi:aryl-alcohol dehydrogenase-like predicted oxidoreductase
MLAALKWSLKNESVDTAIVGITDLDELEEDARAMAEPFRKEDAALLARLGPVQEVFTYADAHSPPGRILAGDDSASAVRRTA